MIIEKYLDEVWKPISGYHGLYEVSNYGRIKSLNYYGRGKHVIMRLTAKPNTYIKVGLRKEGKMKYFRVHRLVAEAFLPTPQQGRIQVNHKNGNKQWNYVCMREDGSIDADKSNLEWCTPRENSNNPITKHVGYHLSIKIRQKMCAAQRLRFKNRPEDLKKFRDGWKRWYSNRLATAS